MKKGVLTKDDETVLCAVKNVKRLVQYENVVMFTATYGYGCDCSYDKAFFSGFGYYFDSLKYCYKFVITKLPRPIFAFFAWQTYSGVTCKRIEFLIYLLKNSFVLLSILLIKLLLLLLL